MSDGINLISSDGAKRDDAPGKKAAPAADEFALHIPAPEPEPPKPVATAPTPAPKPAKPESEPPASLLSQKLDMVAPPPKLPATAAPTPKVVAPPPPVLKPPAPKPPIPPPAPLPPKAPPLPPPPKPPAPPPPKPPQPPAPKPPEPDKGGGDTLRVSLITSGGGAGLSELALRRRLRAFALIAFLGIVLDGAIVGGLAYYRTVVEKRNQAAQQAVAEVDAKISVAEGKLADARDFQGLIRTAAQVLDAHSHWTYVLQLLEERALPEVQFGSLGGAETGTLSFEVQARDYTTLAKQVIAFRQDPRVVKVDIGTASADFDENGQLKGARSSMTLTVDPKIFLYTSATSTPQS